MTLHSRIFVAGHRGMVGSAIVRLLHKQGHLDLLTAPREAVDLTSQQQTFAFFDTHKPEYVFLAAAKVGGIHANNTFRAEFFYHNMMIAANVIEAARRAGCLKLINLGSSCIYPKLATQPLNEEALLTGALEPTNEPYAIAKIAAVKMCRYYNEQYGTEFLSLMPTNLYGPNDNYNLETSHVLPALIRKFVLAHYLESGDMAAVRRNLRSHDLGFGLTRDTELSDEQVIAELAARGIRDRSVSLWGSGTVYREFLHADDVADAAVYFMQNVRSADAGEIVNIGTGQDITIRDLAAAIAAEVGYSGEVLYDVTQPDGTPRKRLDTSKAQRLGWHSRISLTEGLQSVIQGYMR